MAEQPSDQPDTIPAGRQNALIFAATLVTRAAPEAWLLANWERAGNALGMQHALEPHVPMRADLRRRSQAVAKAADALHRQLDGPAGLPDPDLFGILERVASDLDLTSLYRNLALLRTRAREEILASDRRGGQHRIQPNPSGLTIPAMCALIVRGAWAARWGAYPSGTDRCATLAAEALWRGSGGLPRQGTVQRGEDRDHHPRWRVPFENAARCDTWIQDRWLQHFLHGKPGEDGEAH